VNSLISVFPEVSVSFARLSSGATGWNSEEVQAEKEG
jgi:hypothetical protein